MKTQTLTIEGMSCDHCVMHVKKELAKISTIKDVRIGTAVVEVDEQTTTADDLTKAVDTAGYKIVSITG